MVEDPSAWESIAASGRWIHPGERILWRGRPDPRVIFAPQDKALIPLSVLWTGGVVAILLTSLGNGDQRFAWIPGIPFVVAGIYIIFGRFIVKVLSRRRIRYAITDQRAVEITKGGRSLKEAFLGTSMEVNRRRDGRHGSAVWMLGPSKAESRTHAGGLGSFSLNPEMLRGTNWPWINRATKSRLLTSSPKVRGASVMASLGRTCGSLGWSPGCRHLAQHGDPPPSPREEVVHGNQSRSGHQSPT